MKRLNKLRILYWWLKYRRLKCRSRKQLRLRQNKGFKRLQKNILSRSPFYKQYQDMPLTDYPIINKQKHFAHFTQINTQNLDYNELMAEALAAEKTRCFINHNTSVSVGLSSGTSGHRGLFVTNKVEQTQWLGYLFANMRINPLKKQRIALFLRANNNLYANIHSNRIQFAFFDLFDDYQQLCQQLLSFEPNILVAPPQVLTKLTQDNITLKLNHLRRIISVAEVLTTEDKQYLESHVHLNVEQIYQATEGYLAHTCQHGSIHLNEDTLIIEKKWLDKTYSHFNPVITDLNRRTQPIIRYQLDDILVIHSEPCACGSVLTRIKNIIGRNDDCCYLKTSTGDKKRIYPDFIRRAIITSTNNLKQYTVTQTALNKLDISIEPLNEGNKQAISNSLDNLWQQQDMAKIYYRFSHFQSKPLHHKLRRITCDLTAEEKSSWQTI